MDIANVGDSKLNHSPLPPDDTRPQGVDVLPSRTRRECIDGAADCGADSGAKRTWDNALPRACIVEKDGVFQTITMNCGAKGDRLAFCDFRVSDDVAQAPLPPRVRTDCLARA